MGISETIRKLRVFIAQSHYYPELGTLDTLSVQVDTQPLLQKHPCSQIRTEQECSKKQKAEADQRAAVEEYTAAKAKEVSKAMEAQKPLR